jgi:hypothetical protein
LKINQIFLVPKPGASNWHKKRKQSYERGTISIFLKIFLLISLKSSTFSKSENNKLIFSILTHDFLFKVYFWYKMAFIGNNIKGCLFWTLLFDFS